MESIDGLDRSMGSGSRNEQKDWIDENTTAHVNDWSTAQTTFYYNDEDVPKDMQQKYKRLQKWNNGKGEQDRKSTQFSTMVELDARAFANISELTEYESARVIHIMNEMNISVNKFVKSYEKLILAVISLVTDEHITTEEGMKNRVIYRDGFKELMDNCDLDNSELQSIRQQIREKSEFF